MKSAKKLLLLVLSLVLLIGVFAVAAFAEDSATEVQTATVVYPDGTTAKVAVDAEILTEKFVTTDDGVKLYYGENNTLFKATENFTIDGEAIEGMTVTEAMIGKTITVAGFEKVYYTHTTAGVTEYNTSSSTHAKDLTNLLYTPAISGSDIKIYADMTTGKLSLRSAHNKKNYLDLNGHTLKVTATDYTIFTEAVHFAIYSSQPGAVLDGSAGGRLIYSDDDGTTYDNEYNTANPDNTIKACQHMGMFILGERAADKYATTTEYGKNLTVLCQVLSNIELYGAGGDSAVLGGTFVQNGKSSNAFVQFQRLTPVVKNCNFVITDAATVPVAPNATKNFTNCNFVYTGEGSISLTNATVAGTFTNCNFINITPSYSAAHTYTNCAFGTTSIFTTEDLNPSTSADIYLAHGATVKEIVVNEKTYIVDGVLIADPAKTLKLTFPHIGTEYFVIGAKLTYEADPSWEQEVDGFKYLNPYYAYEVLVGALIDADRKVLAVGEAEVPLRFASSPAFTYQVDGEEMQYIASLGSPEEDGANFVALLNDKFNVTIKMYTDIVLPSGVLFGTFEDFTTDGKTKPRIHSSGDVNWDLNGHTVTVAEGATPVPMNMWNESGKWVSYNVLHFTSKGTFKLYSSVEGGRYENKSQYPIFGLIKYSSHAGSYLLGTDHIDNNGGDNLTVISDKGSIVLAYETQANGPAGYAFGINGGTYVYNGTGAAFNTAAGTTVRNAKILTTGKAIAVFLNQFWSNNTYLLEDSEIISKSSSTNLLRQGTPDAFSAGTGKTHKVTIRNVAFAGGSANVGYESCPAFTFEGLIRLDSEDKLAAINVAPEGKTLAYSSFTVYGETVRVLAYYENGNFVNVENIALGTTESWLAGSTYYTEEIPSIQKVSGVWYYYANPVWVGAVDGDAVTDILATENAGKTVVVSVGGEGFLLYFTITFADGTFVPYTADAAAAKASLEARLKNLGTQGFTLKLYANMTSTHTSSYFSLNSSANANLFLFDLNGYTWTLDVLANSSFAMDMMMGTFYFYSSAPGAKLVATQAAKSILRCNSNSATVLGESKTSGTSYGQNITFEGQRISSSTFYGDSLYIHGGTYILDSASPIDFIVTTTNTGLRVMKNATIILKNATNIFKGTNIGTAVENCIFICEKPATLYSFASGKTPAKSFVNCYFYNVIQDVPNGVTHTYVNCYFDSSVMGVLGAGFVAKTDKPATKNVNGVDYTFDAVYTTSAGLIKWGNGFADEYWQVGDTATHAGGIIVDEFFGYAYAPFVVVAGENTPTYDKTQVAAIAPGTIIMSLTLQSQIGLNLLLTEKLSGATVKINGTEVTFGEAKDGYYAFTKAIAPNLANSEITIEITLANGSTHTVKISLATYAKAILKSTTDAHKAAHNLTYAMVEYVRAMTGDTNFCDVTAPAGYESFTLEGAASGNTLSLLTSIRFNLSGTIAIEVAGSEAAEGKAVNLVLATGRSEWGTIVDGSVVFTGLYVNEFFGNMTLKVYNVTGEGENEVKTFIEGEKYTYSLANYLYGISENGASDDDKATVQALYNYAHYADAYVAATKPAAAN